MAQFVIPGAADRTVVIGPTGSGKTVFGAWLLSLQRFDMRPWVALDFKNEELWDDVGRPPMQKLDLGSMPGKTGLYRMRVYPGDEEALEEWLWDIWRAAVQKGKSCGIFVDEFSLVPQKKAMKAVLRQGRSLRLPLIGCTQRPMDCDLELFTESQYRALFGVENVDDWRRVKGLFKSSQLDITKQLPMHESYWYDAKQRECFRLKPCPSPDMVAASLREKAPYSRIWGF